MPQLSPSAESAGQQCCLLNLNFDLAVEKLIRLAESGTEPPQEQSVAGTGNEPNNPRKAKRTASNVGLAVLEPAGLTSNVKISA